MSFLSFHTIYVRYTTDMSTLNYFNKKSTRDSSVDGQSSGFPSLQDVLPGSTTQAVCDETSKDRSNKVTVVMLLMLADIALNLRINIVLFLYFLDCFY